MSKHWGRDYVVTEHRDLQANTMAVDVTGNHVLLAGRRYLAIKHLDEEPLRKFHRQSKYEVGSAEWNPNLANCHLCAISSNTRVEILSFMGNNGYELQPTHSLRAHTRVVSDLNWHPKDPDILATCSIDTYIHIWDIRDQRKPSLSLSAVAGASQVRWNVLSPNMLATAHDGDIKIWDQRKGNSPVQYIAAHLTKIHGLDWCPFQQNQLATSSQDCTVKIFDTNNPRRAESILTTNSPVWRARYTPFGEGLVTIVVPQLRRGENSLLLWNTSNLSAPIYTFDGHTDVVLEFQWRQPRSEKNDFELITWSKDQCLRIFKIPPLLKKLCGHDMDDGNCVYTQYSEDSNMRILQSVQALQLHESNNEQQLTYPPTNMDTTVSNQEDEVSKLEKEAPSPTQPKTLQQEFSLINMNIPNIEVNAMDATERTCTVTASNKNYNVVLKVNFPGNYPYSAQPTFQFCPGTNIDNAIMTKLLKVLKQTAQQRVRKNRSCLEPCLRQLITTLDQTCIKDESEKNHLGYHMQHTENFLNSNKICSNYQDAYIPFPRTSGAKFCSVGILVCFGRSSYARRTSVKPDGATPRALSALGSSVNNNGGHFMQIYPHSYVPPDNITISSFYFEERITRKNAHTFNRSHGKPGFKNYHSLVTIYDASSLFFVNKELAEKYVINTTDISAMCQANANIAASLERPDLVQAWCLAALVISQPLTNAQNAQGTYQSPDTDAPWSLHPFGQNLIHSLIQHYANQSDIQMAGMLSCAFSCRSENSDMLQSRFISKSVNVSKLFTGKWWLKPGGSPYHTIHPADTSLEGWNFPNLKQNRSNSWSESLDGLQIQDTFSEYGRNIRLLDEKNTALYDAYKKAYAEVLHRWRLLDARAQVLKHVSTTSFDTHKSIEFQSECLTCNKSSKGPQCSLCKRLTFQCVVCHISVRGPSNFCIVCGHGGHTYHLASWFKNETVCPTGCGCYCLQENMLLLKM
ncbi:GATOR complex protein WDR59 isoform X1 [Nasonia vitripennis]|uniref:RWD domain-containing protein n=1 Tax=Nasonia vitripennis TaxID=7425 RepID=A0A7M7QQJ4_NASVI|nr:GATOR complex protein WDR59 isoform X1 [Nasonia vitripennis]XP_008215217.1 GATOR complex protein WDR59 isoform X1 [Nasonia vitripennis]XP_031789392.1 GATOR complex protein WDR59 isoform X1 [Nasonia vitripennis]XP_031789393.1 GATOR complex protein WDR59 isoform X1 [Nasonia vitripennis]